MTLSYFAIVTTLVSAFLVIVRADPLGRVNRAFLQPASATVNAVTAATKMFTDQFPNM